MGSEESDSMKIPLELIAHEMETEPSDWALQYMWVEVEVDNSGDVEPIGIDEETVFKAEQEYVNLLVKNGRLTREEASRILGGE